MRSVRSVMSRLAWLVVLLVLMRQVMLWAGFTGSQVAVVGTTACVVCTMTWIFRR